MCCAGETNQTLSISVLSLSLSLFFALESVSYLIKKSNPTLKRNVKFDDETHDLVMDIKLNEDAPWQKIWPDQAKAAKKNQPKSGGDEEIDASSLQGLMGLSTE